MSRFAVIDIPDYTAEEKKIIFSRFALPKVMKRMSMKPEECVLTPEGLDIGIENHSVISGIRDLEQAAEHIAANALYPIEVNHVKQVVFDAEMVEKLLGYIMVTGSASPKHKTPHLSTQTERLRDIAPQSCGWTRCRFRCRLLWWIPVSR